MFIEMNYLEFLFQNHLKNFDGISTMNGQITTYSNVVSSGIIAGKDGILYQFFKYEWFSLSMPLAGMNVVFDEKNFRALHVSAA